MRSGTGAVRGSDGKGKHRRGLSEMPRNYWLDLFTGTTWKEFLKAGGKVSGRSIPSKATIQQ